jgi:hypothetical protein
MTLINEAQIREGHYNEDILEIYENARVLASDQDQVTFITNDEGKRVFAIVPVEFAQHALDREDEATVAARAGFLSRRRR